MLCEIKLRFSREICSVKRGIEALNPCDEEALLPLAKLYDCNTGDLHHEVHQFRQILDREIQAGLEKPSSIRDVKFLELCCEVFHEVLGCVKLQSPFLSALLHAKEASLHLNSLNHT